MATEGNTQIKAADKETPQKVSVNINLMDLYKFEPKDLVVEIDGERYSNHAMIQVTDRDVYIDFLSMPGIKKDGKMVLRGTRIFMPHSSAQTLAESLGKTLEIVNKDGRMTTCTPQKVKGPVAQKANDEET
jgi:hypothetical protein